MSYHVVNQFGDSEDNPRPERMREIIEGLVDDHEHPDAWLEHASGWTLSVFASGLVIWQNMDSNQGPWHQTAVSKEKALRLWSLLARGDIEQIKQEIWEPGHRPPRSESEQKRIEEEAAQLTLNSHLAFYNSLGSEDPSVVCRSTDCKRGTIRFSVFCRIHHFENVMRKICPFDH